MRPASAHSLTPKAEEVFVKIGINLPATRPDVTPELLRDLAREADELGFSKLLLGEHVVLFDRVVDRYQTTDDGKPWFPADSPLPDPLVLHAYLAAATERIRLGTGVVILPQRNPVYTAKHVATLDWVSRGRVDLGIGIGWSSQEFRACAVPWEERAARSDEYVEVLRALWTQERSTYHGRFYALPECRQYPKPLQRPHPPIWIGGWADAALERAARIGDGWYGFDLPLDALNERLAVLRSCCARRGRDPESLPLSCGGYSIQPSARRELDAYAALGIGEFVFTPQAERASELRAALRALAREFLGR
jgi:probable F420-dependent oxidoreductase